MKEKECHCLKNYADALATVNKLLIENHKDELESSTFEAMNKALKTVRQKCERPYSDYAAWGEKVVSVAQKPTREKLMKLRREKPPYVSEYEEKGQSYVESAFKAFFENKPKDVRERLLESARLTLHESLRDYDHDNPIFEDILTMGTTFSEGQWIITDPEHAKHVEKQRAQQFEELAHLEPHFGPKKLPKKEKGYHKLIDEETEIFYEALELNNCKRKWLKK